MGEDGSVGFGDGWGYEVALVAVDVLLEGLEEEAELWDDGDDEGGVVEAGGVGRRV